MSKTTTGNHAHTPSNQPPINDDFCHPFNGDQVRSALSGVDLCLQDLNQSTAAVSGLAKMLQQDLCAHESVGVDHWKINNHGKGCLLDAIACCATLAALRTEHIGDAISNATGVQA